LDIETAGMRGVASDIGGASRGLGDVRGDLGALGDSANSVLQAGLEAFTVAWGAALEVLTDDLSYVSQQVAVAANVYESTDHELAAVIVTPAPGAQGPS
jgi:hypothetical protein